MEPHSEIMKYSVLFTKHHEVTASTDSKHSPARCERVQNHIHIYCIFKVISHPHIEAHPAKSLNVYFTYIMMLPSGYFLRPISGRL
ncbi:hypothetical protein FKM82_020531 [Ascaphus truei]